MAKNKNKNKRQDTNKGRDKQGDPMSTNDSIYNMRPSVESQQNTPQASPKRGS